MQELITLNDKKFLIIGIGINILTNPNVNTEYQTTNILLEAKKKPQIMEIINLIHISSTSRNFDIKEPRRN